MPIPDTKRNWMHRNTSIHPSTFFSTQPPPAHQMKAPGEASSVWTDKGEGMRGFHIRSPTQPGSGNGIYWYGLWMGGRKQSDRFCFLLFQINRAVVKPEVNVIPCGFKSSQLHSGTGKNVNRACNCRAGQNTHRLHTGESAGSGPRKMKR